jgi:2-methylisocitrate lyase-like PEP mutase family enzyme
MMTQEEKAERFRSLHEGDPFIIPNPWDVGSAKALEYLGFEALATTSSGFAFTLGRADGKATLDEVCSHVAAIARATNLPLSVDLENGYGAGSDAVANAIERVAEAGAVGGSIEDWDEHNGIYPIEQATERIAAAVEARSALGFPFMLTARAENYVHDNPDLDDTIARLQAFEQVGADVLYAPRVKNIDEIRAICDSVTKPVNVLAHPGLTMKMMVEAGGQRISVGGQLTWVAAAAMAGAAQRMRDEGDFSDLAVSAPLDEWLGN